MSAFFAQKVRKRLDHVSGSSHRQEHCQRHHKQIALGDTRLTLHLQEDGTLIAAEFASRVVVFRESNNGSAGTQGTATRLRTSYVGGRASLIQLSEGGLLRFIDEFRRRLKFDQIA